MYKQMIHYAGEKMYVMTPYLILEEAMIETLLEAVRRGVDVRIIGDAKEPGLAGAAIREGYLLGRHL